MITSRHKFIWFSVVLGLCCLVADVANAQRNNGGGGNFGGGNFGGNFGGASTGGRSSGTSGTRDYPNSTTIGDATVSIDPETRRVIVMADDETLAYVSQVISNLDKPKPQALINVVFLEVTHNAGLDLGVEGSYTRRFDPSSGVSTLGASNIFGLAQLGGNLAGNNGFLPGAGLYQLTGQNFQATLRMIATASKTEVLSRPSVLVRNNQPATILVGRSIPLINNTRFDSNGNQINTVSYQDVGIILRVTPFISSDGLVEMIVSPEISDTDLTKGVTLTPGVTSPVINRRSADTVVVTPDGQTVVIGGLMQNSKTKQDSKIPLLGDIPLLGALFKHHQDDNVKTELLIFLTPHVVQSPAQLASASTMESDKSVLGPKAFTEQELNQYFDTIPLKKQDDSSKTKSGKSKPR